MNANLHLDIEVAIEEMAYATKVAAIKAFVAVESTDYRRLVADLEQADRLARSALQAVEGLQALKGKVGGECV